jgi:[protein-PII] uridylyltransferase
LFCLSNALQQVGLSIWFAKINTEGERVVDVFYVSSQSGQKVIDHSEIARIRQAIGGAVEPLEARSSGPSVVATAAS